MTYGHAAGVDAWCRYHERRLAERAGSLPVVSDRAPHEPKDSASNEQAGPGSVPSSEGVRPAARDRSTPKHGLRDGREPERGETKEQRLQRRTETK